MSSFVRLDNYDCAHVLCKMYAYVDTRLSIFCNHSTWTLCERHKKNVSAIFLYLLL